MNSPLFSKCAGDAEEKLVIPSRLEATCRNSAKREAWLVRLPEAVRGLKQRWSLVLGPPFENASAAWVAPANLADGTTAVLKLGMPHLEGLHEIDALRFWNGEPTIRLLDSDRELGAMLLERCDPGSSLWMRPKPEQDVVLAEVLKRLWRTPIEPHPFRHLSSMLEVWKKRTLDRSARWPDSGLVLEGLRLLEHLSGTATREVLLATDLHPGNVLRSRREPWLVIDPKPFVGDPAYDATQHLLNDRARLCADPEGTVRRFAEFAGLEPERVKLWTFARAAAEPRDDWSNDPLMDLAWALRP
jgi:streptomycin 6-kinase